MDIKLLGTVFISIFLAEIADKTQLATLIFASDAKNDKFVVFFSACLALISATALAVFAGTFLGNWLDQRIMSKIAGFVFVAVGIWTFFRS